MLNVTFSCEIKKRIFLENQNSLLMIISTHGSVAPEMAALGVFHCLEDGFGPE